MDDPTYATRIAQTALQATNPRLRVDGRWGDYTDQAYRGSDPATQGLVDSITSSLGTSVASLRSTRQQQKEQFEMGNQQGLIAVLDANTLIRRYADQAGLGDQGESFERLLALENPVVRVDGSDFYDPAKKNSLGYRGLAQADPAGRFWADATKQDPTIGSFITSWSNPDDACKAIVAYQALYLPRLKQRIPRLTVTSEVMYLIHNQGPGAAYNVLTGKYSRHSDGYSNQSILARGIIDRNLSAYA